MLLACSHVLLATADVPRMTRFFSRAFDVGPRFANDMFAEFVFTSRFRVAIFTPAGASARTFRSQAGRDGVALGVTVADVDATYRTLQQMPGEAHLSGPPKDHPWGAKSFLVTDPDGNRWEVCQSPSADGMLVNHDEPA